ncbi:predicted protein [Verticillium alfalfae VaMs.102]|uniref:Predicted protein n=1 Tax=Verticillium alfalfae (strain VaMs.102 / ATCC MYA-4576 / FGSC 10136) TaxID=526221 RepID=C9ST96_VERA1|nr:predicted protein [Verticillium alfalfae VaMs.102]EEY22011.1 predicted protein [Verticillium alfalfae VaMs.102]
MAPRGIPFVVSCLIAIYGNHAFAPGMNEDWEVDPRLIRREDFEFCSGVAKSRSAGAPKPLRCMKKLSRVTASSLRSFRNEFILEKSFPLTGTFPSKMRDFLRRSHCSSHWGAALERFDLWKENQLTAGAERSRVEVEDDDESGADDSSDDDSSDDDSSDDGSSDDGSSDNGSSGDDSSNDSSSGGSEQSYAASDDSVAIFNSTQATDFYDDDDCYGNYYYRTRDSRAKVQSWSPARRRKRSESFTSSMPATRPIRNKSSSLRAATKATSPNMKTKTPWGMPSWTRGSENLQTAYAKKSAGARYTGVAHPVIQDPS